VRKCGCEKTSIVVVPAPPAPIAGGLYDAGFIAFLVVERCADSMPIYRIEKRFARLGIPISRSTMNDLVLAAGEKLRPLYAQLTARIASVEIVLADETSMHLQDRTKRGFVWVFHGRDDASGGELCSYVFATDRSDATPAKVLGASEGALIVDGYTGYNVLTDPAKHERGGCWCHARRGFFEARTSAEAEADGAIAMMRRSRPSTPCARAHSPALILAAFAAFRHARASRASSIFRIARDADPERTTRHPAIADRSRRSGKGDRAVRRLFAFPRRSSARYSMATARRSRSTELMRPASPRPRSGRREPRLRA